MPPRLDLDLQQVRIILQWSVSFVAWVLVEGEKGKAPKELGNSEHFCSLWQGELNETCEEVERYELCHGGGSLHWVRYWCYQCDLIMSVRLCGEVRERNYWRTSLSFVIIADSCGLLYTLVAPASRLQIRAVTGASLYISSSSISLFYIAAVSVRKPCGSHFCLYPDFLESFHLQWTAHWAWKLCAHSGIQEQAVFPTQLLQNVEFQ